MFSDVYTLKMGAGSRTVGGYLRHLILVMRWSIRVLLHSRICIAAAGFFAACATHPLPEDISRRSTFEIAQAIRCEARQAILEYAPDRELNKAAIGYAFNFDITEESSATAGVTFTRPFISPSKFDLTLAGAEKSLKRQAIRKFSLVDYFDELKRADCADARAGRPNLLYPITGTIGLREVIRTFISLERMTAFSSESDKLDGQAVDFSDDLKFTTTLMTGTTTPHLVLNPVPSSFRLVDFIAAFGADRTELHEVTVALALPAAPDPPGRTAIRAAARRYSPVTTTGVLGHGVASKIALHAEPDAKVRVLLTLDRRRFTDQTDQLIEAVKAVRP